jgi:small-conductance mechanosensitive channel
MSNLTIQIIITVVTMLIALAVGLYLRLRLVRRLKKTVLDNWLIQVLGLLVIIPPVIAGIVIIPFIYGQTVSQVSSYLQSFAKLLNVPDLTTLIWRLFWSGLIILLAIGIGRTLIKLAIGGRTANHLNANVRILLGRISYIVILIISFFWILSIWDVSLTVPTAAIGIITVGLTFVIQDILKNFAAGIYLLLEGPFHIGDHITTDTYTGKVEDVQLRATKLRIASGEQVIVPNAKLFSDIVINKTIHKERRATITITMPQEEYDKAQTTERILEAIKEVDGVMVKPEPALSLIGVAGSFGTSTGTVSGYTGEIITLTLRFWIPEGPDSLVSEVMLALRSALPRADLAIREPEGM